MGSIYVCPFNVDYVKFQGTASADEFRDWVSKYGDRFLYSLNVPQKGDVIVFAWIKSEGEWEMVGDGIIRSNHMTGSEKWCDCEPISKTGYARHLIVGGIRLYPRNVQTKEFKFGKGLFHKLTPETYMRILSESVNHW